MKRKSARAVVKRPPNRFMIQWVTIDGPLIWDLDRIKIERLHACPWPGDSLPSAFTFVPDFRPEALAAA